MVTSNALQIYLNNYLVYTIITQKAVISKLNIYKVYFFDCASFPDTLEAYNNHIR